ncbi:MAG TPA: hypothetical protein VGI20_10130 [Rhizomicrobium sp.]
MDRAELYREHAEELRAIARDWISDESQTALLKVALDYERMAKSLEREIESKEIAGRAVMAS